MISTNLKSSVMRFGVIASIVAAIASFQAVVRGQIAIPLDVAAPDIPSPVSPISSLPTAAGNCWFFGTDAKTFLIRPNGTITKIDIDVEDYDFNVETIGDEVFVSSKQGLWLVTANGKASKINGIYGNTWTKAFGEQLLAGNYLAAPDYFLVNKTGKVTRIENISGMFEDSRVIGERLAVLTTEGLWLVGRDAKAAEIRGLIGKFEAVGVVGGEIFVGTSDGLWKVNKDNSATKIESVTGDVSEIVEYGDESLVLTNAALWLVKMDGTSQTVNGITGAYTYKRVVADQLFVGTTQGVWLVGPDGRVTKVQNFDASEGSFAISAFGDKFLAGPVNNDEIWVINRTGTATKLEGVSGRGPVVTGMTIGFLLEQLMACGLLMTLDQ